MKKSTSIAFVLMTVATLTAGSSFVYAQDKSAVTSGSGSTDSVGSAKDFQERKAKILEHISERITRMQQIQTCVQAANDFNAMKACKPRRNGEHDHK